MFNYASMKIMSHDEDASSGYGYSAALAPIFDWKRPINENFLSVAE
jgi:hypothetical protein